MIPVEFEGRTSHTLIVAEIEPRFVEVKGPTGDFFSSPCVKLQSFFLQPFLEN